MSLPRRKDTTEFRTLFRRSLSSVSGLSAELRNSLREILGARKVTTKDFPKSGTDAL